MREALFLFLAQHRIFWASRDLLSRLFFSIKSRFFTLRYGLQEERTNFQTFRGLLHNTWGQLLLALLVSIGLQAINPYLQPFYEYAHLKIPDDSDYVTFLATVSGISGIFIGLYFAGITTVGASVYSQVPNNLRELLARERFGNVYMRFLAFLTFIGLCLIGLRILGYPRIHLAIPLVVLLSGVGIIAFVKYGRMFFYLFDPTHLSYSIFEDLRHWLKMVSVGGYRWNDQSFQAHANKQATVALETLETLADLTTKAKHLNGRPYVELAKYTLWFLIYYQRLKDQIPSVSLWFEQRYSHRDWYRTDDSALTLALQTGTMLQPEVVNDKLWIEDKLIPIVLRCVAINLKAKRFNLVQELLEVIDAYLKSLSEKGEVKQAFDTLEKLNLSIFTEIGKPADKVVIEEPIEHRGLAERLAIMPITILLSYSKSVSNLSRNEISRRLARIRWQSNSDIYLQRFHEYMLPRLEWFKPRMNSEVAVEDKIISPLWYQAELIVQVEAEKLVENINCLISTSILLYQKLIDQLNAAKHQWLASVIISREWEYWKKMESHIGRFLKIWKDINEKRYVEGLQWPDLNTELIQQQIKDRRKEVLKLMAQQSTVLLLIPRPSNFIDYGGQFLHTVGESILDALCNGDFELIKATFKAYLYGCLLKFENLRPQTVTTDWRAQQEFKVATTPLLDLMELSGYAKLLADFHGNPSLWTEVTAAWDEYLNKEQASHVINLLAAAVVVTEAGFEIPHHGVLRTGWNQKVENCLAVLPRKEIFHRRRITSDSIVIHDSPLVRIFAREPYGSFHDGIDIFIALYLRKRPEGAAIDFGRRRRDLEEDLAREEDVYKRPTDAQEEEDAAT